MKHEILKPIQKQWLEWLLGDGLGWMSIHINAPDNHQRIIWSYVNGIYDVGTKQLLNYLLAEFNKNSFAKRDWKDFLRYREL